MLKWLGGGARERPPRRVAVIDAVAVDRRRSVVLIRRDNIEHLVMIGGPTDVVIEPNIIRAFGAREPAWPAAPGPTRLAGALSNRLTPPEVPPPPARNEAPRVAPPLMEPRGVRARTLAPPEEPPAPPQTVHKLEELKRQLEAALRRSPAPQGRPPVTDPLAVPPPPTVLASKPKIEPKFEPPKPEAESKLEPKPEPKPEKPPEPEPLPKDEPAEPAGEKASDIL
jgi:flagellar protein FliO/FliZ